MRIRSRSERRGAAVILSAVVLGAACGGGGDDGGGGGPVVATRIAVSPANVSLVDCRSGAVTASAYDADDRPLVGVVFTFASTAPGVVSVGSDGALTAHGAGTAYVRVTAGSLADSALVTVADSFTARLTTRVADLPIATLDTVAAEVRDCRGALRAGAVTYLSLDENVVTVDAEGVILGVALGYTYVRASWAGGSDSVDVAVVTHPAGTLGTPTPVAGNPYAIAVRRNGEIVVAQHTIAQLAIMPAAGGSYTSFSTGIEPTDLALSRDGNSGFVTNQLNASLGTLNLLVPAQVNVTNMGMDPFRVLRSRDGSRFYVTGNGQQVRAVNPTTGAILTSYTMEADQNGIGEAPSGSHLYISSVTFGVVREVTVSTGVVGRSFATGGTTQEVVVSRDGRSLFVADEASSYVQIWDLASGTKTDSILVGGGTFGMALSPDGQRLYATAPSAGQVYIMDPIARTLLGTLPVGGTPRRVAFNALGTGAVVGNESGWVDFID